MAVSKAESGTATTTTATLTTEAAVATADDPTLEQARRFLEDEHVRSASLEKKISFLRSKGLQDDQIAKLLDHRVPPSVSDATTEQGQQQGPQREDDAVVDATPDRPPIVTYPEFLSQPPKAPPLLSVAGFFNTLYAFGGLSATIYGTSKLVLAPMVDSLTSARVELHQSAARNLDRLVEKLEAGASEVPPGKKERPSVASDDASSCGDPAELFHRDVGVQTSLPSSPLLNPHTAAHGSGGPLDESAHQAARISSLVTSAQTLSSDLTAQSEEYGHVQTLVDVFREDLTQLENRALGHSAGYSFYGSINRSDPDDEIKRAKENVRRIKGMLLSARSFPASTC